MHETSNFGRFPKGGPLLDPTKNPSSPNLSNGIMNPASTTEPTSTSPDRYAPGTPRSLRNWALGGTALVGAAGAIPAHAATVEAELAANGISTSNGTFASSLNLDLTGDGIDDFDATTLFGAPFNTADGQGISLQIGKIEARAFHGKKVFSWTYSTTSGNLERYQSSFTGFSMKVGSSSFLSSQPQEFTGYVPVKFTDSSINGGEESNGWLGIRVTCTDADDHAIDLVKLIYDDASTAAPDIFGDVGVVIGDDGVVYYLETDGPTPVAYFLSRALFQNNPMPRFLPATAEVRKRQLQERINVLEGQAAAAERRLSALKRARTRSSPRAVLFPQKTVRDSAESRVLSRKLGALRKKIRALKQRTRNL